MFKSLLNAIHDVLQQIAHITLIPIVAALKAIIAFFTYLHDELIKV